MAEETKFVSHEIGEEKPKRKKIIRRKKIESHWDDRIGKSKKMRIDRELESIYEDNGKMPNMREIKIKKRHPAARNFFTGLFVLALMAAAAWAGFFYLPNRTGVNGKELTLRITGPTDLNIAATTTYTITYTNRQKITLKNAVLTVNYPESFVFLNSDKPASNAGHTQWNIGDIAPNADGEIKITGTNFGALDQKNSWRIFVNYQPENFNSEMQANATLETKITVSPFSIGISGPDKVAIGDSAEYIFTLKNDGDWQPNKLIVAPTFPTNFYISSSTPAIGKDSTWVIARATSTPEIIFKISGKYSEVGVNFEDSAVAQISADVRLPFGPNGRLYSIGAAGLSTDLLKNSLTFSLAINGTMTDLGSQPGDVLNMTLYLKNTSRDTMKNASIKLALNSPALKKQSALNWAELDDKLDGDVTGEQISDTMRRGQIVWTSSHLPALTEIKPNDEITIDLRLPVKDARVFDLSGLTEFKIEALTEVVYKDKTGQQRILSGNPIVITLNSDLAFESRDTAAMENGLETREINWIVTNNFHPLKNLELSATLFGDVGFTSVSPTPAGAVVYDADTQKITWTIAEMPESVDILALPFTITINKKNPTQSALISKVRVKAEDTVTGQTIEFMGDETPLKTE
ncbi:MAG: hypothetical protein PHD72_01655 [Patescibacteria group bacterium]|nr:hypothetical protein [Patescibacteria group bacterium]